MKKEVQIISLASSMFLSACSIQKPLVENQDLASPIEGFYRIKNLKVDNERIKNSKKNVFRVLKESDNEVHLLLFYSGKNPGFGSGIDQLKKNGEVVDSYFEKNKVAEFYPKRKGVNVKYKQGSVYQFEAKRFRIKKNQRLLKKIIQIN